MLGKTQYPYLRQMENAVLHGQAVARALEAVQSRHRTCHAIIVGASDVSYGERPSSDAPKWREEPAPGDGAR